MTDFGLGTIYAILALGFMILFVGAVLRKSFIYLLIGKYGFLILGLLTIYQSNIDLGGGAPASMGFAVLLFASLLILLLVLDLAYFFTFIIPKRKGGQKWGEIIFGKGI